jgi:hypothetical protein
MLKKNRMRESRTGNLKVLFIMLALLAVSVSLYAQSDVALPQKLEDLGNQIEGIMMGKLAQIILACCFAGSCIAYGYNKDNEKVKGKLLAVVVATGLLFSTRQVLGMIWG